MKPLIYKENLGKANVVYPLTRILKEIYMIRAYLATLMGQKPTELSPKKSAKKSAFCARTHQFFRAALTLRSLCLKRMALTLRSRKKERRSKERRSLMLCRSLCVDNIQCFISIDHILVYFNSKLKDFILSKNL